MAEKILIISPVPLFPQIAGNRNRIRAVCSGLIEQGYILDFFYTGFNETISANHSTFFNGEILKYRVKTRRVSGMKHPVERVQELISGVKTRAHKRFRHVFDGSDSAKYNRSLYEYINYGKVLLLKEQVQNKSYKAVILNYAPYSHYFDLFSEQTLKIIDTHDRLTNRYKLFTAEEPGKNPVNWHSLRYKDEKRAIAKADIVWAITDEENRHFKKMVRSRNTRVFTLGHLMPYEPADSNNPGKNVVLIGSHNRLNLDGLNWFLEKVWKSLKQKDPDIHFIIAGSICNAVEEINDEKIQRFGLFDSPADIYSKGEVFINPMQTGTGLKIKTFEALAKGKFVVSTTAGATGLDEFTGSGLICSDDPAEWVQQIASLFNNPNLRKEETGRTKELITEIYKRNLAVMNRSLATKQRK